ncbi:MAG: hypothetical protein QMC83_10445 [Thermodesulfovibrionales bacterium]|nr:hypothetical protein [Thermodesulfovibrionales bacterium]
MGQKNVVPPNGQKLYLVTFEFFSNEKRTRFKKGFYAKGGENLKEDIDKYFMEYYGFKHVSDDDRTFSCHVPGNRYHFIPR